MKKLFSLLATLVLLMGFVFADEAVLFDYSAKADVLETGYDWVSNAKAVGVSGTYEPGRNLYNPVLSEKYGLCIRTDSAPQYSDSRYAIEFIEPSFNEPNSLWLLPNIFIFIFHSNIYPSQIYSNLVL